MKTGPFIIEYCGNIYKDDDINAVCFRLKNLVLSRKTKPSRALESKGMNSWPFTYEKMRISLGLYGRMEVHMKDRTILKITSGSIAVVDKSPILDKS